MSEEFNSMPQLLLTTSLPSTPIDRVIPDAVIAVPAAPEAVTVPEVQAAPVQASVASNSASGRPFRVKLRGSVLVLVRLPNKRLVRAAIHQLSTTGGVIHLEKPLDEKLEVEMIFHIREATIRNKAQMLFPMWATQGWMQPFRFVALPEQNRETLDSQLKWFLGETPKADTAKAAAAGA